jgi:hypothetical protein
MANMATLYFIIIPMAIASVVVASLPLRSARVRAVVLGLHVLVSMAAIMLLEGPRPLWVIVFGTGLAIAATRLVYTIPALRNRRR